MKAVLMAFVMTIRLSSGIRVPFLLSAEHTTGAGRRDRPSRANNFKLRHYRNTSSKIDRIRPGSGGRFINSGISAFLNWAMAMPNPM
jgi:hypothetical protein